MESIGEGVTNVKVGDHVIPLYTAGEFRGPTLGWESIQKLMVLYHVDRRVQRVQVLQVWQD